MIFFVLWAVAAIALWLLGALWPGLLITSALIAGGLTWMIHGEAKGAEFMIDGSLYATREARVVALGKERSEYLGADWGAAAWKRSCATFYQTKNGALFSVDRSYVLVMVLFCPVSRDHRASAVAYQSPEECLAAMTDKNYGKLSAKESTRILDLPLKVA